MPQQGNNNLPPLPQGYQLDSAPPLPAGYKLDAAPAQSKPLSLYEQAQASFKAKQGKVDMPGSFEGHPENMAGYIETGPIEMAKGVGDIAQGNIAKGGSRLITGGMTTAAPAAPFSAAGAPLTFARAAAGGYLTGKVAEGLTKQFGGNEYQQAFANDLGNLGGGFVAGSGLTRALLETPAKELAAKAVTPNVLRFLRQPVRASVADVLEGMVKKQLTPTTDTTGVADPATVAAASQSAPAPYRLSGNQIVQPGTATPKRILPVNRQLPAAPEPELTTQQPLSSPYRLSGEQIISPKTATPKQIIGPERQLNAAPSGDAPAEVAPLPFLKSKSPQAAQAEIFKKMGVSAPAASAKPLTQMPQAQLTPSPKMSFANANSGEAAAMQQLTGYSINDLRGIAMQRGLKVLPSDKHIDLINKISDSLTQPEIDAFHQAAIERQQPSYELPSSTAQPAIEQPRVPTGDADMLDLLARSPAWLKAARAASGK